MTTGDEPAATGREPWASGPQQAVLFAEQPLELECGRTLGPVEVAYQRYGTLNASGDNAILICHALTGSAHAAGRDEHGALGWWDPLIGPGRVFDTDRYAVFCSAVLGSCVGTTGPTSLNPATGRPFRAAFPVVSIRDMVRVQQALLDRLGVTRLVTVAGGSMGAFQALEWGLMDPDRVGSLVLMAGAAQHSAWAVGLGAVGRSAILNDPTFNGGDYDEQPAAGLGLARAVAMLTYRADGSVGTRHGRDRVDPAPERRFDPTNRFQVERYLEYQGQKLVARFDANSYLTLSRAMDLHDVSWNRADSVEAALSAVRCPALVVGISTDVLYPPHEQRRMAAAMPAARYVELDSSHGHDAFLIEYDRLDPLLRGFLANPTAA